ncbi:hypothetical protein [Nocardia altamirensis]|uniref:hypothetical protein n=1 Tax=Nocardia altamirensis TaxID=472158 RepID=UPI00083FEB01|nr:hypothetical protein [Nocardia altamirensis]
MNFGLVEAIPASTTFTIDRKGPATMADKTTAQTATEAVLGRLVPPGEVPVPNRKHRRGNGFPVTARIERKGVGLPRNQAFRANAQHPRRIPGRG